ncbi:hypothetical protein ElyMa_005670100 [Elysia marginata]|uniref:Uncharacterized protein n=1 Tax=Elysia marginata TaxID=1093978 RepID=A0AAV4FDF9_9GAST|nr:hypothetical protein ElyMa_005670100 [Elysia marginata]
MSLVIGFLFAWCFTAECGFVSEVGAHADGQRLNGAHHVSKKDNSRYLHKTKRLSNVLHDVTRDSAWFGYRLTKNEGDHNGFKKQDTFNNSFFNDSTELQFHSQGLRRNYTNPIVDPRAYNFRRKHKRRSIRGRREARSVQTSSKPEIRIIVRVRRRPVRRPDFTQLNKGTRK